MLLNREAVVPVGEKQTHRWDEAGLHIVFPKSQMAGQKRWVIAMGGRAEGTGRAGHM